MDEHERIGQQIEALRLGRVNQLDRQHLIEFLTYMTVRDRRELKSALTVLLIHLLKIRVQPERLTGSWISTSLSSRPSYGPARVDPQLGKARPRAAGRCLRRRDTAHGTGDAPAPQLVSPRVSLEC